MKSILPFLLIGFLFSCETQKTSSIKIDSKNNQIDSVYIIEPITDKILARVPANDKKIKEVPDMIEYPTTGIIQTKNGKQSYLTILLPHKEFYLTIEADSSISTNNLGDSLLNYLSTSNNEFIGQNSNFIFGSNNMDSIITLFQNFETFRKHEIEKKASQLTMEEKEFLLYQNSARIHSFLFYFGRIVKHFPASQPYFSFIDNIDNNSVYAKSLPQNLLYKHEINYLQKYDSIESIKSFIDYVTSQTKNKDLLDFLKASYISEIITSPSYWPKHEALLNSQTIKEIMAEEKSNKDYSFILKPSNSFLASQKGEKAYNFEAERIDGSKVKLSDFKGKVVFIDSWASWCGACIVHRPNVLKLAQKYSDNKNVQILMISMDKDIADWRRYLTKNNQLNMEGDLIIKNGMDSEYGNQFNVKQIPKYMLINKDGIIINTEISEPSVAVEEMIDYEISKM